MATNPYSYGSLGVRWTVGDPTSKSLLDISRVKNDANRWTLEQLITDPDDSATLGFGLSFASSEQRLLQIHNTDVSKYFQIYGGRAGSPTSDHLVFSTGTNGTIMEFDGANHWITFHDTAGVQKMYYRGDGSPGLILESGVVLTVGGLITANAGISGTTGTFSGDLTVDTSTLKVDSSNNRVGVGVASPKDTLHVKLGTNLNWQFGYPSNSVTTLAALNDAESAYVTARIDAGTLELNGQSGGDVNICAGGLFVDASADRVGIGTTSPLCRLDLVGTGGGNPTGAVPAGGLFVRVTDTATVGEGAVLRLLSTNGAKESAATIAAVHTSGNNGDMTFGVYAGGATHPEDMRLTSAGNLLIGYTSSNGSYKLQVNSQIFATNATIATSDGRYKEDVQTLSNATDLVSRLNPVQFRWKAHETHNFDVGKTDVGFIAQEVQEVLSDTDYSDSVVVTNKTDDEEFLGLGETKLIPLLTAALQEAITKIETLETKVAALEAA